MKHLHLFMGFLLILFSAGGCGGQSKAGINSVIYYIDPSSASNGNGSEASPYNTFSGVTFEPGAEYRIKRGTILYEEILVDVSGKVNDPVIIGAYGTGADPVIDGSDLQTGWIAEGGFYTRTLIADTTETPGNVSVNGTMLNFNEAGALASGEYEIETNGKVNIYTEPSGKTVRVSRRYFGVHGSAVSYVKVENLHIRQASMHGISFENSHNITVSNCVIEMCGGAFIYGTSIHAGNGIEFGNSCTDCTAENCTIRNIFDSGVTAQTYSSNESASDIIFRNLDIEKCGFAGVELAVLAGSGNTGSSISNVLTGNVRVRFSGAGFSGVRHGETGGADNDEGRGIKIAADSGAGSMDRIRIEDSLIESSEGEGIYLNGDTGISEIARTEIIANKRNGISLADPSSSSIGLKIYASLLRENTGNGLVYNSVAGKGLEVYNCTFYNNTVIDLSVLSSSGYLKLKNNIYYSAVTHLYLASLPAGVEIDYNCYYENGASIIGVGASAYISVADFHAAYLSCDNSGTGADPSFDVNLVPGSSDCRGKGTPVAGVVYDLNGNSYRNPPTMGAFEY